MLELDSGVRGREAPVDPAARSVARQLPRRDLPLHGCPVGQPAVQALPGQRGKLNLGHVQPAAVLGGVVQFQPAGQSPGLGRLECLIQRRGRVGVEVVLHEHDRLGIGIVDVGQGLDAVRPVDAGAPGADYDVPPAAQRLARQEQVAYPAALVLVVLPGRLPWRGGQRRAGLGEELAAGLVQADQGAPGVIRPGIDLQHILHPPDELGVLPRRNAPAFRQPWLELVCFKAWRTVSCETASTTSSWTSRSASSRSVQRLRPSGGVLHAKTTRRASCSPSSLRRYSRSGALRSTAAASPPAAYCWRTRATVVWWTSSAVAIARSVQPGPASPWLALSRMRAWVRARAGALPWPIRVWSRARSCSDKTTTCCLRMLSSSGRAIIDAGSMTPDRAPRKSRLTSY